MNQHATLEEPRVWYRYAVREVRFLTDYVLSEEQIETRATLMSGWQKMADDVAYREQHRPGGLSIERIETWVKSQTWLLEEALESPDFRRWQSAPLGSVSVVVEDTA